MQKFYETINSFLTSHFFLHLLFCNCHAPMERYTFGKCKNDNEYSYSIFLLTSQFSSLSQCKKGMSYECTLFNVCIKFSYSDSLKLCLLSFTRTNISTRSRDNVRVGSRLFYLCDVGCWERMAGNTAGEILFKLLEFSKCNTVVDA